MNHESSQDADAAKVDAFMRRLALELETPAPRDGRALWVRLQVAERQRLARRAEKVRRLTTRAALVSLMVGGGWLAAFAMPQMSVWLRSLPAAGYIAVAALVVVHSRIRALRHR